MPVKVIVCVAGVALSVMIILAVRLPVAVGVNIAATTQLALAAKEVTERQSVPLAGVANAKSPGLPVVPNAKLIPVNGAFPVLVSVTVCCALIWPCT